MPSKYNSTSGCQKDNVKSKVADPDLTGKVILITGGTGGIGAELVVHLSNIPNPPAHIIFTGRNATSANKVIERCRRRNPDDDVAADPSSGPVATSTSNDGAPGPHPGHRVGTNDLPLPVPLPASTSTGTSTNNTSSSSSGPNAEISFITMDLSSLESVSAAADEILSLLQGGSGTGRSSGRLDILLANAGIMAHPPGLSVDGYEIQFATNHLGHALLIRKLLPIMLETASSPPPLSTSATSPGSLPSTTGTGTGTAPPAPREATSKTNKQQGSSEGIQNEGSDVRIIITSSAGWRLGKTDNFPFEEIAKGDLFEGRTFFAKSLRYGNSKLANVVYARELALRFGDDAVSSSSSSSSSSSFSSTSPAGVAGVGDSPTSVSTPGTATADPTGHTNDTDTGAGNDITPKEANTASQTQPQSKSQSQSQPPKAQKKVQKKGILSISLTPGVVSTNLVHDLPLADRALIYASQLGKVVTVEEGIRNHLWAISSPRGDLVPGAYYEPVGKLWSSKSSSDSIVVGKDPLLGGKMWDWTESWISRWL